MAMLGFLMGLLASFVGLVLGCYVLFLGRRALSVTLGIMALAVAANVLSELVAGGDRGSDLIGLQSWSLIVVALAIGAIGVALGRYNEDLAAKVIGFIAGGDIALWLFKVFAYLATQVAELPQDAAPWLGVALFIIGGVLGVLLIRWNREEALILLSVIVGVELINDSVGLDPTRGFTAIIILGLALAGILVQYGIYLREHMPEVVGASPDPVATGLAYFQELDLD
jgi:hypothetical protein